MKIQILMSVYNGEKYLEQQLDSLLTQKNVEAKILVRDDGSSDNSINILNKYQNENANISVVFGENIGVIPSFFELIKLSGDYPFFAFCDQDDIWLDDKLDRALAFFDASEIQMYCSKAQLVDEKLNAIKTTHKGVANKSSAMIQNIAIGCTCVIDDKMRNFLLQHLPSYSEIQMHDSWFYKVAVYFGKVHFDDEARILYRQHSNNVSGIPKSPLEILNKSMKDAQGKTYLKELIEFQSVFKNDLSEDDNYEISRYLCAKKNFLKRLKYLFNPYVKKQSLIKNIWFYFQFLFNLV